MIQIKQTYQATPAAFLQAVALALAVALSPHAAGQNNEAAKPKPVRNDRIYPPSAAAAKAISFDGAGFSINGSRTYLSSGTIHYPRVPHELWHDRLLRMKNADFANVETYCFWNYHEPRENQWNFSGDGDLENFLTTAQDLGLTAIVRVGPYVCAEWEAGGWPLWLRFKPAMNLRTADPEFLKWNTHWYDKILPIVAKHQIHKGGNVVMVQLENEHPLGWGVVDGDPYFDNLHAQAEKHRIEVPWFFSGLNHGGNPAPGDLDPAKRGNPWFSTEFWAGWFDSYGSVADKKLVAIEKANWSIMAHGGGGQNFYMLHGGSNFDSWSDNSTASSYDFGAAIGQSGELRPSYYKMKRANLLAASFPGVLANGTTALSEYKSAATGNKVEVHGARRSSEGTLLFLRNNDGSETTALLAGGGSLRLPRYTTIALPRDLTIRPDVKISTSTLPILCRADHDNTTTLVFYGQPGESGSVVLALPEAKTIALTIPDASVAETLLDLPGGKLRILAVPQDLSLRTWRMGPAGKQLLVFGPEFVQSVSMESGQAVVTYERYFQQSSCGRIAVYGGNGRSWQLAARGNPMLEKHQPPVLSDWKTISAASPAAADYNDSSWFTSEQPLQMGADGDNGSQAWYRGKVSLIEAGKGQVNFKAKDNRLVFVNGKPAEGQGDNYRAEFVSGDNTIAIFTSHAGRNKGFGYCKEAASLDPKGVLGPVTVNTNGKKISVTGWKMKGGPGDPAIWSQPTSIKGWQTTSTHGAPAFHYSTFDLKLPAALGLHPILRLKWTGLPRGMVWVNGHCLGRYPEKIRVDSLYIPEPWLKSGANDVVIFDDAGASPKDVSIVVDRASREIARTTITTDTQTPIVVPREFPVRDLDAMNVGNVAFKCRAIASSEYNKNCCALSATDGDPDTFWKPASSLEAGVKPSLDVDLSKQVELGAIEIVWDGEAKNVKYALEGSVDGLTWKPLGNQSSAVPSSPDSPSDLSRFNLPGQTIARLRVIITEARHPGIGEVRVYSSKK